jgi:hypothetical protein
MLSRPTTVSNDSVLDGSRAATQKIAKIGGRVEEVVWARTLAGE